MNNPTLTLIDDYVRRGELSAARHVLSAAVSDGRILAHDGVELMLALRQGSRETFEEALAAVRAGLPGSYRFVPKVEHAFA